MLLALALLVEPATAAARRINLRALAGLALPLAAGAALFAAAAALPRGKPYLDGDWRARAAERAGELPALALHALRLLADPTLLGLWLLPGAALVVALVRRDRAALPLLAAVHLELLLALGVIYLGYAEPRDQANVALPRVAAALLPLGLIGAARLSAGGRGGRVGRLTSSSSRPWPCVLPWASVTSDAVPPPPSESCSRKLSASRFGTSKRSTSPWQIAAKCALTRSAVTSRRMTS